MSLARAIPLIFACLGLASGTAGAQTPAAPATVIVTVADPSGAVIPNATVTVSRQDAPAGAPAIAPVSTSAAGIATIDNLAPGRYTIVAEFPGFETVALKDYRVRSGEHKRTLTLPIRKLAEDVVVGRDGQTAGLDPRGNAFSTVLTREQIEALPDDPEEMEAALKAMSPPGAQMRIDGFSGGRLPPKSQIRSIRLPRMDQMAAQNHGGMAGMMFIDIMTQPGNGPLRGSLDFTFRDDALNARNPFTPTKGDEGLKQGGLSFSGTLIPNKSSFSLNVQNARQFNTGNLLAALPGQSLADSVRQPTERLNLSARFDQALNKDHMLRASYQRTAVTSRNLGVGGYDLNERGYTSDSTDHTLRFSENGAVGRRFFSESRVQIRWNDTEATSFTEGPAFRVLDAFTAGGAQRRGGSHGIEFEAATDLDYVRGAHSMRTGVLVEAGRYRSNDESNYFGTYTFASLADYEAGRPANYTRRIGDPEVRYSNLQVGLYAQDDYRLSRGLMLSYGLRYETETLLDDRVNLSPRVSLTWSPLKSGRTTFRGGWGYFNDWIGTGTYEQTLRVDGFRQQEINIQDPAFPIGDVAGAGGPSNRYLFSGGLRLPSSVTMNAGVDQQIGIMRVSATYTRRNGIHQLRGRNTNTPVDGVRPDSRFGNIVEVVGDAEARMNTLGVSASVIKLDWRQTFLAFNYAYSRAETNATGAFSLPASGDDLSTEWGPSQPKHRYGGTFNMRPFGTFGVAVNLRGSSGSPYNITTGRDDNGDGVFNDRPAGTARNTALTAAQWDLGVRLSYSISFGPVLDAAGGGGGGTMVIMSAGGGGGGMPGGMGGGPSNRRFRVDFYASAQNVTNHRNFVGYSGVLTSPFFAQPTNVMNPRKIEMGMRFGF